MLRSSYGLLTNAETKGRNFENNWIPIKISSKFVPKGSINNIPALVQIMVWRRWLVSRRIYASLGLK